jgi:bidirectional [NiFe] hydrogenase diaphorase subunit
MPAASIGTASSPAQTGHPSGDKRFKILDAAMRRHQFQPHALLEVLHTAQGLFGYLADDLLIYIGRSLRLPLSRVYGVATFYHLFSLKPRGAHACVICMGTACYVKGAAAILDRIERACEVKAGDTTADGQLSLLTARCIGACGVAPVVVFDGEIAGNLDAEATLQRLKGWTGEHDP